MRPRGTDEFEQLHAGSLLEMRRSDSGHKHYLNDRPLSPGDAIELLLSDGSWLRGIYEWRGAEVTWPGFRFSTGGGVSLVAAIHPGAILRWPPR